LLSNYESVVSVLPGRTDILKHDIQLIDFKPVVSKYYPVPLNLQSVFYKELMLLVQLGIIRKSRSPYRSYCLLVKKSDGDYRLVIDYRALNAVTKFDAEPGCSLEEELFKFSGAKYFSELDICKAYYQVELTETSIPYTAFSTPWGLYEFVRMPFGLVTACATYIRLMRRVLDGLNVSFYFDNVLVASKDWSEHVRTLDAVFGRLRDAGLTVKPSKCSFGMQQVNYLGFCLTSDGIFPRSDKLDCLTRCPVPTTKTSLRSFIGLCSFYSKFIPNFSVLTAPLTDLLKKGVSEPLPWSELLGVP